MQHILEYSVVRKTSPASIEKMVNAARLPHPPDGALSIPIATKGAARSALDPEEHRQQEQSTGQCRQGLIGDTEGSGK